MPEEKTLSGRGRKPNKVSGKSFRQKVARRIRERRLELQLRAEVVATDVSNQLGRSVSVQTWYHWEKATHPFDIDVLPAIAKALRLTPRKLLPDEKNS